MKKNIYLIIIFMFFINFINVNAAGIECTKEEETRLKELADKVEIQYEHFAELYNEEKKWITSYYEFNVLNRDYDLGIYYKFKGSNELIKFEKNDFLECYDGDEITFYIKANTVNLCYDKILRTINYKLPYYNSFYYFNKEKCDEYPDFQYCKEYLKTSNISYNTMETEFNKYVNKEDQKYLKKNDNYTIYYIAIGGIVILATGITVFIIKKKKDDL